MTANSSVDDSMPAQADLDDADEEELSPYPMFEGTLVSCVKQFRMTTPRRVVMRLMLSVIIVMKKVFVSIPCK
jgi:hypothetical protein